MAGISIGTDILSLKAQRSLSQSSDSLARTFARLSSGQRINTASDDPAGLAVSSTLQVQRRVHTQAVRNSNDAISALNVTEGALGALKTILIRQKELATQAANGVYTLAQRQALDAEANALASEFNRVVGSTQFNGINLFSGDTLMVQCGVDGSALSQLSVAGASQIMQNVGDGTFQAVHSVLVGSQNYLAPATGDFNGDGKLDWTASNKVFFGAGDGTYSSSISFSTSASSRVETADVNNDGKTDIIDLYNGVSIVLSNGNGTFQSRLSIAESASRMSSDVLAGAGARITDADIAQESSDIIRGQILQKMSTAVLAQCTQSATLALKLLRD